jgi:hypothetical protein
MKETVFWHMAPCRYCVNRRFGGTYCLHLQDRRKKKIRKRGTSVSRCGQTNVEFSQHSCIRAGRERRGGGLYRKSVESSVLKYFGMQFSAKYLTLHSIYVWYRL